MGTFYCQVEVFSADGSRQEIIDALVDTGSTYTCLPADLLRRLGHTPNRRVESELADGRVVEDEVGDIVVRLEGIETPTRVIFADEGSPNLLGAYTLEGALLAVDPPRRRLVPSRALRMHA